MSMRECATRGCRTRIREGLRRSGYGANGQPLADGVFCARCRARQVEPEPEQKPLTTGTRVTVTSGRLSGLQGRFLGLVQVRIYGEPSSRLFDTNDAIVGIGPARFTVPKWSLRRLAA